VQALIWTVLAVAPFIDTPGYDYHPSAMAGSVYTCGASNGGDGIYRNGALVLARGSGADSRHACAPSVIAHTYAPLVGWVRQLSGKAVSKAWLMYYECESLATDGHPSICVAVSADQQKWWRWNGAGWGSAQPILTGSTGWYGAGHPSAMVLPDGRVRLAYYDWDGVTSYHVADSWDGLHFWPAADWHLPFPAPGPGARVHYLPEKDQYLVLSVVDNRNVYTVGTGTHWSQVLRLGESSPDRLAAPGKPTLQASEQNHVQLGVPVTLFSGEFNRDCADAWWQCGSAVYAWQGQLR